MQRFERLFSPAKINLCLKAYRKRKDGYHDIETLFERVDLGDSMTLQNTDGGIDLRSTGEKIPQGAANLAVRAAELLKKTSHSHHGVRIFIRKRIPVSAGLGGGSSNAAAVLMGLNRLWNLRLSRQKLMRLGAGLGSDVPFFIMDTSFALGRGRGEILTKIKAPSTRWWHVLIKPPFKISTQAAYQGLNGSALTVPGTDVRMLTRCIQTDDLKMLSSLLSNNLELALNKRVAAILKIKIKLLKEGALGALLSGSGSCVFGLFASRQQAQGAAGRLRKTNKSWKVFVASTY